MKILNFILLLVLLPVLCAGQFQSSKSIDPLDYKKAKKSYQGVKGSPYLFKDWVKADMIHLEKEKVEAASIRLDLIQNSLEIKVSKDEGLIFFDEDMIEVNDEKFVVLTDNYYNKIIITREANPDAFKDFDVDTIYLMKGIHRDYLNNYGVVLYDGDKVKLIKAIDVVFRETKINSPGKIEKIKKFFRKSTYALIIDKELIKVKLKDKEIYKALNDKGDLKKYSKSNKLKLKKESDFVKLLEYWDSIK